MQNENPSDALMAQTEAVITRGNLTALERLERLRELSPGKGPPPLRRPRGALPHLVPAPPPGPDKRAAALENEMRLADYIARLAARRLPLPADPQNPVRLHLAQVAREAGLRRESLVAGGRLRPHLDAASRLLGVGIVHLDPAAAPAATIAAAKARAFCVIRERAAAAGGLSRAGMDELRRLFSILEARAGAPDATFAEALAALEEDARAGRVREATKRLAEIEDLRALLASAPAEADLPEEFAPALEVTLGRLGLTVSRAAQIMDVASTNVSRWLSGDRVPDARFEPGLRLLERKAGLKPGALVGRIRRRRAGRARVSKDWFPEGMRGALYAAPRRRAVARRFPDGFGQRTQGDATAALAEEIQHLEAKRAVSRLRDKKRRARRLDRDEIPMRFREDLASYLDWAQSSEPPQDIQRLRSPIDPATAHAYEGYLLRFARFCLGPPHAVPADELDLAHVASPVLWADYFRHLMRENVELAASLENAELLSRDDREGRLSRAHVERLHAVEGMLNPFTGYLSRHPALASRIAALPPELLPAHGRGGDIGAALRACAMDLAELRKSFGRVAREPVASKDEIDAILALPNPLCALAPLFNTLHAERDTLRRGSLSWANACRSLVLLHLLSQTAFRVGMHNALRVSGPQPHLVPNENGFHLIVERELFKNEASIVFKEGPYRRELVDVFGAFDDIAEYLEVARRIILAGRRSDRLFVTAGSRGADGMIAHLARSVVYEVSERAIGLTAPGGGIVARLRPHHFRDILATAMLKTSKNVFLAADAIHVTPETVLRHYARYVVADRAQNLADKLSHVFMEANLPRLTPHHTEDVKRPG